MDVQNPEEHFSNSVFEAGTPHDYSYRHGEKFVEPRNKFVPCQFLPIVTEKVRRTHRWSISVKGWGATGMELAITLSCTWPMRVKFTLSITKLRSINPGRRADL
jgi:hypothetical protein